MPTSYPGGLDAFTNPAASDTLDSPPHDVQHADANDAVEAIEAELGTDPSGTFPTVRERVEGVEAALSGLVLDDIADVAAPAPTDGQVLTWDTGAALWRPEAPSGGGLGGGAHISQSAPQAIPGSEFPFVSLLFDVENRDDADYFDPGAPDRLTVPVSGLYLVNASWALSNGTAADRRNIIELAHYDSVDAPQSPTAATEYRAAFAAKGSVSGIFVANAGDYFVATVYHENDAGKTTNPNYTFLALTRVG